MIEEAAAYYLLRLDLDLDFKVAFLFAFCSITVNNAENALDEWLSATRARSGIPRTRHGRLLCHYAASGKDSPIQ
jgi:hypothetical protein